MADSTGLAENKTEFQKMLQTRDLIGPLAESASLIGHSTIRSTSIWKFVLFSTIGRMKGFYLSKITRDLLISDRWLDRPGYTDLISVRRESNWLWHFTVMD